MKWSRPALLDNWEQNKSSYATASIPGNGPGYPHCRPKKQARALPEEVRVRSAGRARPSSAPYRSKKRSTSANPLGPGLPPPSSSPSRLPASPPFNRPQSASASGSASKSNAARPLSASAKIPSPSRCPKRALSHGLEGSEDRCRPETNDNAALVAPSSATAASAAPPSPSSPSFPSSKYSSPPSSAPPSSSSSPLLSALLASLSHFNSSVAVNSRTQRNLLHASLSAAVKAVNGRERAARAKGAGGDELATAAMAPFPGGPGGEEGRTVRRRPATGAAKPPRPEDPFRSKFKEPLHFGKPRAYVSPVLASRMERQRKTLMEEAETTTKKSNRKGQKRPASAAPAPARSRTLSEVNASSSRRSAAAMLSEIKRTNR